MYNSPKKGAIERYSDYRYFHNLIAKAIPELQDGKNCFIRNDNQSFADICIEMLDNQLLRDSIREHGRKTVIEHYSWEEKLKGYEI